MTYAEFKKQAGIGADIAASAGIGAEGDYYMNIETVHKAMMKSAADNKSPMISNYLSPEIQKKQINHVLRQMGPLGYKNQVQAANRFGDVTETIDQTILSGKRGLLNSVRDNMAYRPALRLAEIMRRKPGETVFDKAYQLALKNRPDLPSSFK